MLLALACEHVHAVHAYTTGIHILGCSIPHTPYPHNTLPGRVWGMGYAKGCMYPGIVCMVYVCTSTHEAIYSFVLVFYECECTFHRAIPWAPRVYGEHTPWRRVQGTYPHTRVHTRVWISYNMNEVMIEEEEVYIYI